MAYAARVSIDPRAATGTTQAQRAAALVELVDVMRASPNVDVHVRAHWEYGVERVTRLAVVAGGMETSIDRKGNRT